MRWNGMTVISQLSFKGSHTDGSFIPGSPRAHIAGKLFLQLFSHSVFTPCNLTHLFLSLFVSILLAAYSPEELTEHSVEDEETQADDLPSAPQSDLPIKEYTPHTHRQQWTTGRRLTPWTQLNLNTMWNHSSDLCSQTDKYIMQGSNRPKGKKGLFKKLIYSPVCSILQSISQSCDTKITINKIRFCFEMFFQSNMRPSRKLRHLKLYEKSKWEMTRRHFCRLSLSWVARCFSG